MMAPKLPAIQNRKPKVKKAPKKPASGMVITIGKPMGGMSGGKGGHSGHSM